MTTWTPEEARFAQAEGWDIFNTLGDPNHPAYELCRIDAPMDWEYLDYDEPLFDSDEEAWRFVVAQATLSDSLLHKHALAFLAEHAPEEYADVLEVGSAPFAN